MTAVDTNPTTAEEVHAAAEKLAPTLAGRAAEIERARRLPADLLEDLIAAGCFRLLVPREYGGVEADLPSALRALEVLSRADGSVGWTVMIGAGGWCDLAALPRSSFDAMFTSARDFIVAGAFNPSGTAEPVDGGYRISGRWSFASGCEHASWMWANCLEGFVDGVPQLRIAVLAPEEVVIEDTWNVSGLCGTGSHHFSVRDVVVPADRTLVPLVDEPRIDTPIVRIPAPSLFAMGIAGVALGIAQGALDDVVELATTKMPLLAAQPLATNPHFQFQLATADTELRAARALLNEISSEAWSTARDAEEFTLDARARIRAAAAWATARAANATTVAYGLGGGSSLYSDNPLQRRLRDIYALTQHFLVKPDTLTTSGAVYAGQEIAVPVF